MEKMSVKDSATKRSEIYNIVASALADAGYESEAIKGGRLVDLGEGYFGKINFAVCDATKFDLDATRAEYADACVKAAERAEASRLKAEEKEKEAKERAAKAAEKVSE